MNKPIEKGSILAIDGSYYIFIRFSTDRKHYLCICDNANNIYSYEVGREIFIAPPKEAISFQNFGYCEEDELREKMLEYNRAVPVDVIAEALVGLHDDRFEHCSD